MMIGLQKIAIPVSAIAIVGCAPIVYDGRYDYFEGWREASVVETGTAKTISRVPQVDCREERMPGLVTRYAFVKRGHDEEFWTTRVVPIAPETQLQPGDRVYVNIEKCVEAVLPEKTK